VQISDVNLPLISVNLVSSDQFKTCLRRLSAEGLIRRERERLVVMDRAGLQRGAMK
jgi:hypothetical protein